jgi:predicted dehydrogenase
MLLRFADGEVTEDATGLISVSMTEGPKYTNRLEFYGSDGAMRIEHRGELFIAKTSERDWQAVDVELGKGIAGIPDTGFSRGFMDFAPKIIEAILNGKTEIECAATFKDGLRVQKVLDAARESDASGCVVPMAN